MKFFDFAYYCLSRRYRESSFYQDPNMWAGKTFAFTIIFTIFGLMQIIIWRPLTALPLPWIVGIALTIIIVVDCIYTRSRFEKIENKFENVPYETEQTGRVWYWTYFVFSVLLFLLPVFLMRE